MKATKYILILTGFLGLGACSADENNDSPVVTGDAVEFTISMEQGVTRAFSTLDNYWTMNDEMAVCEGTDIYQYKAETTSASSGGRVRLTPSYDAYTYFWSPEVLSRTFSAWYPYSASKPSTVAGVIDQRSDHLGTAANKGTMTDSEYNQLDLLYAPNVTVGFKESVNLDFYHQMCRIIVTVNSTGTKGAKPVTSITFGKNNVAAGGTLTPGYTGTTGTGAASWEISQTTSVQMRLNNTIAVDEPTTIRQYTYECIVPPQSLAGTAVLFQITTTDKNNETKTTEYIPNNLYQDAPDFQAGYQYNFMLTLSRQGTVNISTCQVIDWTTSNVSDLTATVPDAGY